mmetsp:Transcript_131890/g.186101  ORF Transcript_131890/g.186101 Transcript_131890/m.186101 type:complete len:107 (-) Transcript_131890:3462-3782(-)
MLRHSPKELSARLKRIEAKLTFSFQNLLLSLLRIAQAQFRPPVKLTYLIARSSIGLAEDGSASSSRMEFKVASDWVATFTCRRSHPGRQRSLSVSRCLCNAFSSCK